MGLMESLETLSMRGAMSLVRKTKTNERGETESIELCLSYDLVVSQSKMSLSLIFNIPKTNAQITRKWFKTDILLVGNLQTVASLEGMETVTIPLPKSYFDQCVNDAKIVRTVSEFKELLKRLGFKYE
jgi:hypothetical protein